MSVGLIYWHVDCHAVWYSEVLPNMRSPGLCTRHFGLILTIDVTASHWRCWVLLYLCEPRFSVVLDVVIASRIVTLPCLLVGNGYHPITRKRNFWKSSIPRPFVNWSASWSLVSMASIFSRPDLTCERKWWYFWLMCLVRGRIFGTFASSSAPALSSNILQRTVGTIDTDQLWERCLWTISSMVSDLSSYTIAISKVNELIYKGF